MRKTAYFLRIFLLVLFYIIVRLNKGYAQIPATMYTTCAAADATPVNLNNPGNYINQTFNMNGDGDNTPAAPTCGTPSTPFTVFRDGWLKITSNVSGPLNFTYSASPGFNVALVVYAASGGCGSLTANVLQCANLWTGGNTETITINAVAGSSYFLRVINANAATDVPGNLSIYSGTKQSGDLCDEAVTLGIGTCNFPFNINSGFAHNEFLGTSCGAIQRDGWAKITLAANQRVKVTYASDSKNPSLQVFRSTSGNCSPSGAIMIPVQCSDTSPGTGGGTETVEFSHTVAAIFFIRVSNVEDGLGMTGNICITEVLARDDCSAAFTAASAGIRLNPGNCNLSFDIQSTFTATPDVGDGCTPDNPDAWTIYQAPASNVPASLRFEYTSTTPGITPTIVIYDIGVGGTALTFPCASPDAAKKVPNGCVTTTGSNSAAISFTPVANRIYAMRVISGAPATTMLGNICFYEDSKKAEDNFYTANTFSSSGSDCGRQFNLLASFNNQGGLDFETNPSFLNCPSPTGSELTKDAWALFQVTSIPAAGYVVEFNNDNNSTSTAQDIAVEIYRGKPIPAPAPGTTAANACAGATNMTINSSPLTMNVLTTADMAGLPTDGCIDNLSPQTTQVGDAWVRIQTGATPDPISIVYQNTNGDAVIEVYETPNCAGINSGTRVAGPTGFCANDVSNNGNNAPGFEVFPIAAPNPNSTYYIRIVNVASNAPITMNGTLSIYSLTQIACVNNVTEGIEQLFLNNTVTGFSNNFEYYVRVSQVDGPVFPNEITTTGTICIRANDLPPGDLCTNAVGMTVGDCDFDFTITTGFINPVRPTGSTCLPTANIRDGWIKFTATSSETTFEYLNTTLGVNAGIAVFRGSCANLIPTTLKTGAGCGTATCLTVAPNSVGKYKFCSVAGVEYFVQISNVTNNNALSGRVCIYNTAERDVCNDNDLATKFVGDCNIPFDIPLGFDPTGNINPTYRNFTAGTLPVVETGGSILQQVQSSCETESPFTAANTNVPATFSASANDAWMRFIGNGNDVTITYQNKQNTSNPSIVIYTALKSVGPVTCGIGIDGAGNPENQYACANLINSSSIQTESVTFKSNSGQLYLLRIIDLNGTSGMTGTLCIADGRQNYEDPCAGPSGPRQLEVGKCGVPLNVITGINACADPQVGVNNTQYGSNTGAPRVCPDGDCVNGSTGGDVWATVTTPDICDPAIATATAPGVAGANCIANGFDYNAGNNTCKCKTNSVPPSVVSQNPPLTIQYDNRNGILDPPGDLPADVKLVVYQTTNCTLESAYTRIGCSDAVVEGVESVSLAAAALPNTHGSLGRTYLIRIINKNPSKSAYGSVCIFYGSSVADNSCPPNNDYGPLEGEFRAFNVAAVATGPTTALQNPPSDIIPNCVIQGVTSTPPTRGTIPIRADAWMKFTIPSNATYQAVTIQYDNVGFTPQQNAAIAVYQTPSFPNGIGGNCNAHPTSTDKPTGSAGDNGGLQMIDCANTSFIGSESMTIRVQPNVTYFVRVMNIHNVENPPQMSGRIRIFPYAQCNIGNNLVEDGNFAKWPDIDRRGTIADNDPTIGLTAGQFDTRQNDDRLRVPTVLTTSAYPNDLDRNENPENTGIARFATTFGFARDRIAGGTGSVGNGHLTDPANVNSNKINTYTATYGGFRGVFGELTNEGQYVVRQTPWTLKNDWFCYGLGFSGYGGRGGSGAPQQVYCSNGRGGFNREPCVQYCLGSSPPSAVCPGGANTQFGAGIVSNGRFNPSDGVSFTLPNPSIDRPREVPSTSEANFMIINGSYDPANNSLPPGKLWCQTVDRIADESFGRVGYYVFSLWAQNMISVGRNIDVPMLRLTVCDMEDPNNPNTLPAATNLPAPPATRNTTTVLPGVTYASDADIASKGFVYHHPAPEVNRLQEFNRIAPYGAARTCNLTAESRDARLKILGNPFLITEDPDQWTLLRCIYRAPAVVREMNICVENLSLTKNGNDIGIDNIEFHECTGADQTLFDRLLKGDPCELTDNPVGIPLPVQYLSFTGKLMNDKVVLEWLTLAEQNVVRYEVQRSIDGITFKSIGTVDARGTANGMADYLFTDRNLPFGVQNIYYRLNAIEIGGFGRLGPMISVSLSEIDTFEMKLVPNPIASNEEVEVQFNVTNGKAAISVHDIMGAPLMTKVINTNNGINKLALNTKGLQAGVYIIKIVQNGKSVSKKLVVY
jgi:hypothetical protein